MSGAWSTLFPAALGPGLSLGRAGSLGLLAPVWPPTGTLAFQGVIIGAVALGRALVVRGFLQPSEGQTRDLQ